MGKRERTEFNNFIRMVWPEEGERMDYGYTTGLDVGYNLVNRGEVVS